MGSAFVLLVLLAIALLLYFVPWIVASNRNHPNKTAIVVLNIFTGWTFIGWIIALVWACTRPSSALSTEPTATEAIQHIPPAQRSCPECAEQILAAARKCKHCGSEIALL
jgi:hypothetical protein